MEMDSKPKAAKETAPSEDDTFSVIERLADAIRIEDDSRLNAEDRDRIIQDLYEGPRKCECCINWVDEVPPDAELDVLEKADNSHPLILRRRIMPGEERTQVSVHSIEVRHPGARAVLLDVFKRFDGIVPEVKYLVFKPPFHQFFWRWDEFEEAIEKEEDEYTKTILLQLRAIVKKDLAEAFAVSKELTSHGVITHKYLWTLFAPGESVYSKETGSDQFYICYTSRESEMMDKPYDVRCHYIDWDGDEYGFNSHDFMLIPFKGTKKINELRAFPSKYLENYDEVRQRCIERGRKWTGLCGIQYKAYRSNGRPSRRIKAGRKSKDKQIDLRIVLDAGGHPSSPMCRFLRELDEMPLSTGLISQAPVDAAPPGGHRPLQLQQNPLAPNQFVPVGMVDDISFVPRPRPPPPRHGPIVVQSRRRRRPSIQSFTSSSSSGDSEDEDEDAVPRGSKKILSDDQLQLTSASMLGFCLKEKKWRSFEVNRICDIEWNTTPFESLVLPEGYKDLILSFVESQVKEGDTFDDVINGKGGGLVILLSGDPGVGKTLTAESVAEKIQAPLYKMELTATREKGDGSDSDSSDSEDDEVDVESAFDRAAKWKAVLLIDECDMYLEKRSDASPKRNRLVARFLQKLEYYPSLLFLTTNRERVLDPAIYSRIHLTINYPALDAPSRRTIWGTFLNREQASTVSEREIDRLAEIEVNGRRIRNITKTARIMAKRQGRAVSFEDVRHVLRITEGLTISPPSVAA